MNICKVSDILPNTGICALIGEEHIAIFRTWDDQVFAIDNVDPFSKASVLSRGIIGNTGDTVYVASPILKQRFDLKTGQCLDDETVKLRTYSASIEGENIYLDKDDVEAKLAHCA